LKFNAVPEYRQFHLEGDSWKTRLDVEAFGTRHTVVPFRLLLGVVHSHVDTGGKFAAGIVDTGGKFATSINNTCGVVDTGGEFAAGVVDTGGNFATGVVDTGGAP
jgi:hypothetical protein